MEYKTYEIRGEIEFNYGPAFWNKATVTINERATVTKPAEAIDHIIEREQGNFNAQYDCISEAEHHLIAIELAEAKILEESGQPNFLQLFD